jgi:arsenite methyltransferase
MSLQEINKRYSKLAEPECCPSCGGAMNYSEAKPNEFCVDLGSGQGTNAIRLAETVGKEGLVIGIDISDIMVENSITTADRMGISNVTFIKSAFEKLKLDDEIADLVISNCSISRTSDKQAVWNEIFRILKKGGRFVISDIYSSSPVPEEYKNDPEAIAECWAGSITRDEYLKHLEIAGFPIIKILEESAPYLKGKVMVTSWTITGSRPVGHCSWCN